MIYISVNIRTRLVLCVPLSVRFKRWWKPSEQCCYQNTTKTKTTPNHLQ